MRVLRVVGKTLPEAWENAVADLWFQGDEVETEYGERAKEVMAVVEVIEPFAEPRVHVKGIVGKLSDYVAEVVEGVHDDKVDLYGYTYHERLFSYKLPTGEVYNQIQRIAEKLRAAPYTRRAVAVTWQPWKDPMSKYPPCLVYTWFHCADGEKLEMHVHMRSNDALKASFMNMYAFTLLLKHVAESSGLKVGKYVHVADNFHVYERDWKHAEYLAHAVRQGVSGKWHITTEKYLAIFERSTITTAPRNP